MTFADHMADRVLELKRERAILKARVRTLERERSMWRGRALSRTRFSRA